MLACSYKNVKILFQLRECVNHESIFMTNKRYILCLNSAQMTFCSNPFVFLSIISEVVPL